MTAKSQILRTMLLATLLGSATKAAAVEVTVDNKVMVSKPVSPILFGSFIELAFARSDLLSAEMLFDRGFELGSNTLNEAKGWCVFVKPRQEMECWWHSGYEENRWRLVKGKTDRASTMVRFTEEWPAPPNGKFALRVENKSTNETIHVAQDGIWVNAGASYIFSGLLCDGTMFSGDATTTNPVPLDVCLFPEGKLDALPVSRVRIVVDATTCRKFTARLSAGSFTGRTTFALRIPPGYNLVCDMLSLMPTDHQATLRKDAIDAMRQVPAGIVRFPGGCFASTYHWRDGIGDRDTRPVDFHNWWNIPLLNDIGTVEYLSLCKAIGAEAMICVPVMFDDVYNAVDWLAFCNTEHHPFHAKAGIARSPMPVKYWELDNETMRTMDAITYAHRCVEYSRAMKQVDPQIKTIMNCYHVYRGKLREMLEIAGADIDLVNGRDSDIAEHRRDLAVLAEFNAAHKTDVGLCHSEFRANNYELPAEPDLPNAPKLDGGKDSRTAKTSRWAYGLTTLCDFLDYQSFGGDFRFANFTGYNDGWGEGLIYCAKSRVYLSAPGQAFALLLHQKMAWPLSIKTATPAPMQRLQVAWDLERKTLILFALNLSGQPEKTTFDLSGIDAPLAGTATVESLAGPATATVPEIGPNPIVWESATLTTNGKTIIVELRPYSATAIRLDSKR